MESDVPILMISGQYDPIDGLDLAEGAARHLPNALHVIVRHGAHQPQFPGCLLDAASRFIAQGSQRDLDVSCGQTRRIRFGGHHPPCRHHRRCPAGRFAARRSVVRFFTYTFQ